MLGVDISKHFKESFGLEITRVDCITYQWRANGWDESESVHYAYTQRQLFSWRGPNMCDGLMVCSQI